MQMLHPLVEKLEKRLLPEFEKVAAEIRQKIQNVTVRVESNSLGSEERLAHGYCIDCLFTTDLDCKADNIALCVELSCLVSVPRIGADICWGSPSGYIEADFIENSPHSIEISDKVLEDLDKNLPRLYEALFEALRRRKPANE